MKNMVIVLITSSDRLCNSAMQQLNSLAIEQIRIPYLYPMSHILIQHPWSRHFHIIVPEGRNFVDRILSKRIIISVRESFFNVQHVTNKRVLGILLQEKSVWSG